MVLDLNCSNAEDLLVVLLENNPLFQSIYRFPEINSI